jgi:hypothetical protein
MCVQTPQAASSPPGLGAMANMADQLRFDDLALFHAAFEVRFEEALLIWDRSGVVWNETRQALPSLKRRHVEPNKVVFASEKPEIELALELERLGVIAHNPDKNLQELSGIVSKFTDIAVAHLGVRQYSRVGLRLMFKKEFATPHEAAAAFV